MRAWSEAETARFLRVPGPADDKRTRGVVALRTGSARYPGAAVLGVEAAWRTGSGLVRYAGGAVEAVLARRPETVIGADGENHVDAWVIGSGTDPADRTDAERDALCAVLRGPTPVVVDAGALDLVDGAAAPVVITPHAGEFGRLRARNGLDPHAASADGVRADQAAETATLLGCVVLLKGARTVVAAPDGTTILTGVAPGWLATAGTGDVLAGVLGALLAANPGASLAETAASAAVLHALAGSIASGARDGAPGHPIVALDVAEALPSAVGELLA
ncbi:ADP/ATP-dependent (S)-NAD(P)H-hydrate dehydratase [Microbacterium sp.]|uniref:ADP-dependent NAD(P)H-hydrate dehydratase n=1 Tax=Microbacterium sp. TaxID=51671 RepID=UPI00333E57C2